MMKRFMKAAVLFTLTFSLVLLSCQMACHPVNAADKKKTYTVTPKSPLAPGNHYDKAAAYNKKTKTYFMLRSYLQQLEKDGGGELVLKKGTYTITNSLYIPSNTTIRLQNGVKIVKSDDTGVSSFPAAKSIFQLVPDSNYNGAKPVKAHKSSKNVVITGPSKGKAIIDLKYISGAIGIVTAHNTNVKIKNITFQNMHTGHFIEVDAGKKIVIQNNKFLNAHKDSPWNKEAINIDTPDKETGGCTVKWSSFDQTPNENVVIKNNTFSNLSRAIGTHKYSAAKDKKGNYSIVQYHTGIQITNNKFKEIRDTAIATMAWKDTTIKDNTFTNKSFAGIVMDLRGTEGLTVTGNTVKNMDWYKIVNSHSNNGSGSLYDPIDTNLTEAETDALENENTFIE